VINEAQAQRAAARAELDGTPAPNLLADGEVYAMVDSLGDVGAALADAKGESLANLYAAIRSSGSLRVSGERRRRGRPSGKTAE
jgi:hypothetical protein